MVTATVDIPPTVSLTATPVDDLIAPATLSLVADAADADGSIAKVAFYQGNTLLGTAAQAPYAFAWDKVPPGTYSLTAKATDNLGIQTVSTPVPLTVVPNQLPQVAPQPRQNLVRTLLAHRQITFYCAQIDKLEYKINLLSCG